MALRGNTKSLKLITLSHFKSLQIMNSRSMCWYSLFHRYRPIKHLSQGFLLLLKGGSCDLEPSCSCWVFFSMQFLDKLTLWCKCINDERKQGSPERHHGGSNLDTGRCSSPCSSGRAAICIYGRPSSKVQTNIRKLWKFMADIMHFEPVGFYYLCT